jgi:hypothetical protein
MDEMAGNGIVGEANVPLRYRDVQHRGATLKKLQSKSSTGDQLTHLLLVLLLFAER